MRLQDWCITVVNTTAFHHFCTICTGCASLNASSFVWPFLCSAVATRLHRTTWRDLQWADTDDSRRLLRSATTQKLLDQHCPVVEARRKAKQMTPWFNAECRYARRHTRAAERRYRRTCSDVDKRTWLDKLKAMRALYEDVNSNYWRSEIAASSGNTKRLWRTFSGAG